jgi:hypothetical protein
LGDVKAVLTAAVTGLVSVALLPVLLANGDPAPAAKCDVPSASMDAVLATIRTVESGGDYRVQAAGSSASGAYAFLDSSWNGYDGYTHAKDAPPPVQDAKAAELAEEVLTRHGGDITVVPVAWYLGHVPEPGSPEWDVVPAPGAGNRLTPRQYQTKWMDTYQHLATIGEDSTATPSPASPEATSQCAVDDFTPGKTVGRSVGGWAMPLPRNAVSRSQLNAPHHDYPAIDLLVPEGTPVYALTDGTVARTTTYASNWWTSGCPRPGCDTCGTGLSIQTAGGLRYIYCHGTQLHVHLGDHVTAGQHILDSGNTGASGAPHLHVELKLDGVRRCPQPLLIALYDTAPPNPPQTLPTTGCSF